MHVKKCKVKAVPAPPLILACFAAVVVICLLTFVFYRSLEREIYEERAAYLEEISGQVVSATENVSIAQWDLASFFANRLRSEQILSVDELTGFISEEQIIHNQEGLSFLVFDEQGNYYDSQGKARWAGSQAVIRKDSPEQQVEITTLSTTIKPTDEMVFVLRMEDSYTVPQSTLPGSGLKLTHVAVVRLSLIHI